MLGILYDIFPNLERAGEELLECTQQTLQMTLVSGVISFILGVIFGVILIVTRKDGILENRVDYNVLDKAINIIRSIPFLILMVLLIPASRMIMGTGSGVTGAYIPLIAGTVPFFSRQIETALAEVDGGLVEAAAAMGSGPWDIIWRVYLKESIPAITRVTMITAINLIGLTAMAGAIGAGGLGDFAVRYGYQMNIMDLMWLTIIIILIMISIIQAIGNWIIKKTTH